MANLLAGADVVPLSSFSDSAEGKALKEAAVAVLTSIGKADAKEISLDDVMQRQASFLAADFNGDGVLVEKAISSPELKKLFGEITSTSGGTKDRSGADGVNTASIEAFLNDCRAYLAWVEKGRAEAATIMPLGDATAGACASLEVVRAKIDDFFARCKLVDFDASAEKVLNAAESDYASVSQSDLAAGSAAIAALPIARVSASASLSLVSGINPEWQGRISDFLTKAVRPILGDECAVITEADWKKLSSVFAPYIAWQSSCAGASVASLGEDRLKEILNDEASFTELASLIAKDMECSSEIGALDDLEKFVRFHANLNRFLCNYVNFSDYYDVDRPEIYRAGRLYIDGRVCNECVYVTNMAQHSTLAVPSKIFLAYCDIVRPQTGEKRTICAAVTAGFASSLWIGRNGLFYDAEEKDWNAVIVKIVECQISLKEAFWSPWLKICDLFSSQIKKLLSSKESAMMKQASATASTVGTTTPSAPPPTEKKDGAALASSVAAIGIAIGIIGSALGGLIAALKGVSPWQGILGVCALILVVSGPAVLLAWFKLRSRDFAPVLNACGWAINKKMLMPMRLGHVFTHEAVIPDGSKIEMHDPYVNKHTVRNFLIVVLIGCIAGGVWIWKYRNEWLPSWLQRDKPKVECVESVKCDEVASPEAAKADVASAEAAAEPKESVAAAAEADAPSEEVKAVAPAAPAQ